MEKNEVKANAGTLLASGEILLWRFTSKIAPVLIPTILFLLFFLLERWLPSLAFLLVAAIAFYIIARRSLDLPWNFARTLALFTFSLLLFLSLLLVVSLITFELEWSVLALLFLSISFLPLLFAYYFKD